MYITTKSLASYGSPETYQAIYCLVEYDRLGPKVLSKLARTPSPLAPIYFIHPISICRYGSLDVIVYQPHLP